MLFYIGIALIPLFAVIALMFFFFAGPSDRASKAAMNQERLKKEEAARITKRAA